MNYLAQVRFVRNLARDIKIIWTNEKLFILLLDLPISLFFISVTLQFMCGKVNCKVGHKISIDYNQITLHNCMVWRRVGCPLSTWGLQGPSFQALSFTFHIFSFTGSHLHMTPWNSPNGEMDEGDIWVRSTI